MDKKLETAFVIVGLMLALALALPMNVMASTNNPELATASDTHFFIDSCLSDEWSDTLCWSHTSGGVGGAGVPTATNPVVFDINSIPGGEALVLVSSTAASIDITENAKIRIEASGNLTVIGSITVTPLLTFAPSIVVDLGRKLSFGGSIDAGIVSSSSFDIVGIGGGGLLEYTGSNPFGTMRGLRIASMDASGGPTIFCFPSCSDEGGNTNILFTDPNPTTPISLMLAVFGTLVVVIIFMSVIARVSKETGMGEIAEYIRLGAALLAIFLALAFFLLLT